MPFMIDSHCFNGNMRHCELHVARRCLRDSEHVHRGGDLAAVSMGLCDPRVPMKLHELCPFPFRFVNGLGGRHIFRIWPNAVGRRDVSLIDQESRPHNGENANAGVVASAALPSCVELKLF